MPSSLDPPIENRTFAELALGEAASLTRVLTPEDAELFAVAAGDGIGSGGAEAVWAAGLLASLVGTRLPGPGSTLVAQALAFIAPILPGDAVTLTATVREKHEAAQHVLLDCHGINQRGAPVLAGTAEVRAPTERQRRPRHALPEVRLARHQRFAAVLAQAAEGEPVPTAVAHPCDALSLGAAVEAAAAGMIRPILVGPEAKIRAAAAALGCDLGGFRIVPTPHSHAAAAEAVRLVRSGEAELLMKGALHSDELLHEVVQKDTGLRTARRLSHVFVMDVPAYPRPLLVTDAAVNIAPTLETKRDIVQNAIDLARVMGIATPKVAILSAVETVSPALPSTLEAAALCKMADRGQICGGVVDGPLAFDNAVSPEAAREKGIVSPVAGQADILVVPDLEAGNMLAKQLTFLAGADAAGVVVGARVPIIFTSRADGPRSRMASCAVAVLMARARLVSPAAE